MVVCLCLLIRMCSKILVCLMVFPADQVFLDVMAAHPNTLPATLRHLILSEFAMEEGFNFDAVIFTGGMEDVFKLTSVVDKSTGKWQRYTESAIFRKTGKKYTAETFRKLRWAYTEALARTFVCPVLDAGIGFPPTGAVMTEENFHQVAREDNLDAHSLVGHYRVFLSTKLRELTTPTILPAGGVGAVPFPMPYHETGMFWTPTESGLGRLGTHSLNAACLLATLWGLGKFPFFLCPGTPG